MQPDDLVEKWKKRLYILSAIYLGNLLACGLVTLTLHLFGTDYIWSRLRALVMLLVLCLIVLVSLYEKRSKSDGTENAE